MDRPVSTAKQRKNSYKKSLTYVLIAIALVAAFFLLRKVLRTKVSTDDFQMAQIEVGKVANAISAYGSVVPAFEQQVNAPIATVIKEVLVRSGAAVEAGVQLMQLDDEYIQLQYDQIKDQVELKKNNITRLRFEYEKNLNDLRFENEIKALQLSTLEAQLKDAERLQEIGSATVEEVEKAKLDLEIAQLEKKKLDNNLQFKEKTINSDRRNLELEMLIEEKKLKEFQRKLTETSVKAPRPGVVTYINESIGQKVNEGEALVRLANLEAFRIEASCSDRYANLVKVGLPVKVRINAKDLKGYISSILPAVENNTLEFIVELEDFGNEALRPNLRVEIFIISEEKEQVLRVRNGSAFTGAVEQALYVVRGEEAIRERVTIGLTSKDYVELTNTNLKAGDRVIISNMEDYDHLQSITLKKD
ncbi:MAG: efflux RND transporter periplasmic adaptor subunit [Saprospiraceae bacterium]